MYEEGQFVSRDVEQAILYWKFAAFDGLVRAMNNLGRVVMNTKRNYIAACDWYRLAVENGSVKNAQMEDFIRKRTFGLSGKFDSKAFLGQVIKELKESRFRDIVNQCEQTTKNISQLRTMGDWETTITERTERIARTAPNANAAFIVEHRTYFHEMKKIMDVATKKQGEFATFAHPAKLKGKANVDIIGLKPIFFKDMGSHADKIYEGFAVKVVIVDDAIVGQPSVNLIGQDSQGTMQQIFIYKIPQNTETQNVVGYGCSITIVNPYYRIGMDGKPMIRVDNPSTVIYHTALTNKKRCRYCGDPQGIILCKKCQRACYCSQKCLQLDSTENQHKLVCVKKL